MNQFYSWLERNWRDIKSVFIIFAVCFVGLVLGTFAVKSKSNVPIDIFNEAVSKFEPEIKQEFAAILASPNRVSKPIEYGELWTLTNKDENLKLFKAQKKATSE